MTKQGAHPHGDHEPRRTPRSLWRDTLRPAWRWAQPWPILVAAALTLVLGTIGWSKVPGADSSFLEPFYRAVALFAFNGAVEDVGGRVDVPVTLEIARMLGPLVTGYAAVRGLIALFRDPVQLMRIRLLHHHVVVVGLGSTGFRLATKFHDQGRPVVTVDLDRATPTIAGCRERGISVLIGDATDPEILAKARLQRASSIFIACGDDRVDLDVAKAAESLVQEDRSEPLAVLVSLDRLDLWQQLTAEALASTVEPRTRRDYFNVYQAAATRLLRKHDPLSDGRARDPHVVMVGLGAVGESLVLATARLWQAREPRVDGRLRFTFVHPAADEARAWLLSRYPALGEICEVEARTLETDSVEFREGPLTGDGGEVGAVYICLEDEGQGLAAALALAARPDLRGNPIVLAVEDHTAGAAEAVSSHRLAHVHAFGVLSETLTPELLEGCTRESIAQSVHADYVAAERAKGHTPASNPSMKDWEHLPEELKKANRAFADDIGEKLRKRGCGIVPALLFEPGEELFAFTGREVELMAEQEHERWRRHKESQGMAYGPVRDEQHHPSLVDWNDLPEDEKEKDRVLVRAIPGQLARAGFAIRRLDDAAGEDVERRERPVAASDPGPAAARP